MAAGTTWWHLQRERQKTNNKTNRRHRSVLCEIKKLVGRLTLLLRSCLLLRRAQPRRHDTPTSATRHRVPVTTSWLTTGGNIVHCWHVEWTNVSSPNLRHAKHGTNQPNNQPSVRMLCQHNFLCKRCFAPIRSSIDTNYNVIIHVLSRKAHFYGIRRHAAKSLAFLPVDSLTRHIFTGCDPPVKMDV